jgi:hypothetical protein
LFSLVEDSRLYTTMKYSIVVLLVVYTAATWAAPGKHGPHSPRIASCEADQAVRATCMNAKMQTYADVDRIQACFQSCSPVEQFVVGPRSEHVSATATADRVIMRQFEQCQQQQRHSCVVARSNVVFVAPESNTKGNNMAAWGQHGGKGEGKSTGSFSATGKDNRGDHADILTMMMRRAEYCNVTECVKPLIRADLLVDTTAGSAIMKKAMCEARQSCQPSAECESDLTAVKAATCVCKLEAESPTSPNPCMTSAVQAVFAAKLAAGASSASHQFKGKGEMHDPCNMAAVRPTEVC